MKTRSILLATPLLLVPFLLGGASAAGGVPDTAIAIACATASIAGGCDCDGIEQPDVENHYRNSCIGHTRSNDCIGWYDEHYDPVADTWEPSCTGYCPSNRVCIDRDP